MIARGVPGISDGTAQHGSVVHAQGTDCVFTTKAVVMSQVHLEQKLPELSYTYYTFDFKFNFIVECSFFSVATVVQLLHSVAVD